MFSTTLSIRKVNLKPLKKLSNLIHVTKTARLVVILIAVQLGSMELFINKAIIEILLKLAINSRLIVARGSNNDNKSNKF